MTENGHVTGRVFTKLFFAFVVVLFLGMAVLDVSLRQVMERSLRAQEEDSLACEARLVAAQLSNNAYPEVSALQQAVHQDAIAAGADVTVFDAQGRQIAHPRITRKPNLRYPPKSLRCSRDTSLWAARAGPARFM